VGFRQNGRLAHSFYDLALFDTANGVTNVTTDVNSNRMSQASDEVGVKGFAASR